MARRRRLGSRRRAPLSPGLARRRAPQAEPLSPELRGAAEPGGGGWGPQARAWAAGRAVGRCAVGGDIVPGSRRSPAPRKASRIPGWPAVPTRAARRAYVLVACGSILAVLPGQRCSVTRRYLEIRGQRRKVGQGTGRRRTCAWPGPGPSPTQQRKNCFLLNGMGSLSGRRVGRPGGGCLPPPAFHLELQNSEPPTHP